MQIGSEIPHSLSKPNYLLLSVEWCTISTIQQGQITQKGLCKKSLKNTKIQLRKYLRTHTTHTTHTQQIEQQCTMNLKHWSLGSAEHWCLWPDSTVHLYLEPMEH